MPVESGVIAELDKLPAELRDCGLAQGALAVARAMDSAETKSADMASCLRALQAALDRLRELAPPEEAKDGLDELTARRADRLSRSPRAAHKPRS